jgi:hypothetical protein
LSADFLQLNERAARAIQRRLDALALAALRAELDFASGPPRFPARPLGEAFDLYTIEAGAVPQGWEPPPGWTVIRYADWVAAGRPGDR